MSGKSTQTTTTDTGPWKPAQGALQDIIGKAQTYGSDGEMFRPSFGQQSQDALSQIEAYARGGSNASKDALTPVVQGSTQGFTAGLGNLMNTVNGNYMNPSQNPELMNYINQGNDLVANRVNQQFSGAGRYGSNGANSGALGTALSQNTSGILMDQYNRERANQVNAATTLLGAGFQGAQLAPELDNANLANANLLQQVGAARDSYADADRQSPLRALEWQKNMIAPIGAMGQNGTSTQTTQSSNPLGTIMGGVMTGAGLLGSGGLIPGLGALIGGGASSAAPFSMGFASPFQRA